MLFLEPIFEESVYGYRPDRSAHDALGEVRKRLYAGQTHVVDADVVRYFDTIPHRDLLKSVARRIADGKIPLMRHWRETGASQRLGWIVSYADDFVILCASRQQAQESLVLVSRWLKKLGLAIHPDKTRLCFARQVAFDFLGYTFGPRRHWRTGQRILGIEPSKKAQMRLKEKVNTLLYRGNPAPWPELRGKLNRQLRGWANYFSFGFTGTADTAIWRHIAQRARRFLCKRHKLRPQGAGRFSTWEIYGSAGVFDICAYRRERRTAHAP